ncbi:MAG TPA: F0F1 ATP synthase subunit B [Stellaceae bacterium]|nr:F0F1 ATP synthase subunit B [Stellaceae bacterium]
MSAILHDHHFWVLVSFLIFIGLAWKPAMRSITSSLDNRTARIRGELEEARRLRDEAEQLLGEYRRQEREGASQAQSIIAHAREEAERIAAQAARDLDLLLARRQRLAEERIAQAEARATAEVRAAAVDTAIAAAREVIASQIDERRGAALIDSAIAALPQRLR